jgi:nitroreductase
VQVSQAIQDRRSCRDFSPRPVERETLQQLMALTTRAPSAINLQPWQFTVVRDEEVARLSRKLQRARAETGKGCAPDNLKPLDDVYTERKRELSRGMGPIMQQAGVDPASFIDQGSLNFYGAPAVVVACLDISFDRVRALDIGIAMGWLLLAARDLGLDTCPIGLVAAYQEPIKDFLNIADHYQVLLAVALGYGNEGSILNSFSSPRAAMDEVVRWY